jgi:hypothetical protein
MFVNHTSVGQRQNLAQNAKPFTIQNGVLYRYNQDDQYCRCLQPTKTLSIVLHELHIGVLGGQIYVDITSQKILDAGY